MVAHRHCPECEPAALGECVTDAVQPAALSTHAAVLRGLSDTYIQTQKLRIAVENRVQAAARAERGASPLVDLAGRLREAERELGQRMEEALHGHPALPWLAAVRGIGPTLATKLLGQIGDISRFNTVPRLWRFAGYAVVSVPCRACDGGRTAHGPCRRCAGRGSMGRGERRVPGVRAGFNARLKTTLYQVGVSLLRCRSRYREVYETARSGYAAREQAVPAGARWSVAHCHHAALRRMNKAFLAHLFVAWRSAEGLGVPEPAPDPWALVGTAG
jgi:hypothetical protein